MTTLEALVKQWVRVAKVPKYMHDTNGGREALAALCLLAMAHQREKDAQICEQYDDRFGSNTPSEYAWEIRHQDDPPPVPCAIP